MVSSFAAAELWPYRAKTRKQKKEGKQPNGGAREKVTRRTRQRRRTEVKIVRKFKWRRRKGKEVKPVQNVPEAKGPDCTHLDLHERKGLETHGNKDGAPRGKFFSGPGVLKRTRIAFSRSWPSCCWLCIHPLGFPFPEHRQEISRIACPGSNSDVVRACLGGQESVKSPLLNPCRSKSDWLSKAVVALLQHQHYGIMRLQNPTPSSVSWKSDP